MKPLSVTKLEDFQAARLDGSRVLWTVKIDNDFLVEVRSDNYCRGTLHIFEMMLDMFLIHVHEETVPVKCNSLNWPDPKYISHWRQIATDVVSKLEG
jgi:hypothetical protein